MELSLPPRNTHTPLFRHLATNLPSHIKDAKHFLNLVENFPVPFHLMLSCSQLMSRTYTQIFHTNIANDTIVSINWPSKTLSAYIKSSSVHNHLVHSAKTYGYSRQVS